MEFNIIYLATLTEPEYSRVEYLELKQKESGFSPIVFWKKMNDCWKYYHEKIWKEIKIQRSWGNDVDNVLFSLLMETKSVLRGHWGLDEQRLSSKSLWEYGKKNNLFIYYYEYDFSSIQLDWNSSPLENFERLQNLKSRAFIVELSTKTQIELTEFLEFHFRFFKRNKGIPEDWISKTKSIDISSLSIKQKDTFLSWFEKQGQENLSQQAETKTELEIIELKPVFIPEAVNVVFDILKDFFRPEIQSELKQVIETGNKASKKLRFTGNGNRLTDTFKKLIEHDFITSCQKRDLINWIISNFTFTNQNKEKAFVYDTVEKTISRNYYPCKSPLIEIKNGQIQKFEQPRKRKQSKY